MCTSFKTPEVVRDLLMAEVAGRRPLSRQATLYISLQHLANCAELSYHPLSSVGDFEAVFIVPKIYINLMGETIVPGQQATPPQITITIPQCKGTICQNIFLFALLFQEGMWCSQPLNDPDQQVLCILLQATASFIVSAFRCLCQLETTVFHNEEAGFLAGCS